MVGGEDDVLSVTSVVYRSPGERENLGRGRGRGAVREVAPDSSATPDKERTEVSTSAPSSGDTIWERSKAGYTEEHTPQPSQVEMEASSPAELKSEETTTKDEVTVLCRDYSSLPALQGAPRVGDHIAFKVRSSCRVKPFNNDYICKDWVYISLCFVSGIGDFIKLYS